MSAVTKIWFKKPPAISEKLVEQNCQITTLFLFQVIHSTRGVSAEEPVLYANPDNFNLYL